MVAIRSLHGAEDTSGFLQYCSSDSVRMTTFNNSDTKIATRPPALNVLSYRKNWIPGV